MDMQARGHGRLVSSTENKADLKRARKDGKLSEAMLDRRMKLKRSVQVEFVCFLFSRDLKERM